MACGNEHDDLAGPVEAAGGVGAGLAHDPPYAVPDLPDQPAGKDLLRNYKHLTEAERDQVAGRKEDWEHIHGSLGALGSVDDQVGRSGKEDVALVAELRRMRTRLRTQDLRPLAVAAFDLVQRLNEGKTIKYKKVERQ